MKITHHCLAFIISIILAPVIKAQNQSGTDSTGLPGDNFSLQGALQMFQKASSVEEFEKMINSEGNHVNNLDLNEDGDIDYVRVIDKMDKDVHALILQIPVSEKESQDIAVIELEKTGDTTAVVQIVGDEDIYGEQVIVEPDGGGSDDDSDKSSGRGPNIKFVPTDIRVVVNVWFWPSVRFVYGPVYRPWVSPWRWHYYPVWWKPWHPLRWHTWHPFHYGYHRSFVVVHTHRVMHAHTVYRPYHTSSVIVHTRNSTTVGNYRVTKSRTSVTGPRGNTTTVKKTTVRGPGGKVRGQKTTVKRRRG